MYDAQTGYSHTSTTITRGNSLRRAFVLYNITPSLVTCQEVSVVSAVKNDAYHNFVIFGQKLCVERTGNVKLLSNLPGGFFDLKVKQLEMVLNTNHGRP